LTLIARSKNASSAFSTIDQTLAAVADLGIDGKGDATGGVEPHMPPAGVQGTELPLRVWGRSPQKLKLKNTLEAPRKALW